MSSENLNVSLNEISFFVTRAAVGAGAPFGVAEDFANAVRWAARCGLDPAVLALASLQQLDRSPQSARIARDGDGVFTGEDGLSAAFAGTALADFWPLGGDALTARNVESPLLAAAMLAGGEAVSAVVDWPGARIVVDEGRATVSATGRDALTAPDRVDVSVRATPADGAAPEGFALSPADLEANAGRLVEQGVDVDGEAWDGIVTLFRRCLVPSNEQSRMSGAGAGLVDTD